MACRKSSSISKWNQFSTESRNPIKHNANTWSWHARYSVAAPEWLPRFLHLAAVGVVALVQLDGLAASNGSLLEAPGKESSNFNLSNAGFSWIFDGRFTSRRKAMLNGTRKSRNYQSQVSPHAILWVLLSLLCSTKLAATAPFFLRLFSKASCMSTLPTEMTGPGKHLKTMFVRAAIRCSQQIQRIILNPEYTVYLAYLRTQFSSSMW